MESKSSIMGFTLRKKMLMEKKQQNMWGACEGSIKGRGFGPVGSHFFPRALLSSLNFAIGNVYIIMNL